MYGIAAGFLAVIAIFLYDTGFHHRLFREEMKARQAVAQRRREDEMMKLYLRNQERRREQRRFLMEQGGGTENLSDGY